MSLFKLFLPTLASIGLLTFSGCGDSQKSVSQPTVVGETVSIKESNPNATMVPAPATLKNITSNITKIVETDVTNENQKEATSFTKETRYCDISGLREFEYKGSLQKVKKLERFHACKATQYIQNGYLTFNYARLDSDGKYPQVVDITVNEDYTFNDILLKKGTIIESQISYKSDKHIKTISIKINGVVTYQYGTYRLINEKSSLKKESF